MPSIKHTPGDNPTRNRVLLLNSTHEPLSVITKRRCFGLLIGEKAAVVQESDMTLKTAKREYPIPSIVVLHDYVRHPPRGRSLPLTTKTVLSRDSYRCAYCGERADTIDHVIPRYRGGPNTWENVVAACKRCNSKKGHKTLEEWGVPLLIQPFRPIGALAEIVKQKARIRDEWNPYLGIKPIGVPA